MRKNIPPDPFLGSSTRHGHNFLTCPFRFGKIVVSLHYPNWSPDRSTQPERRQIPHPRRDVYKRQVERFRPLDKAGAYGVQEWIGLAAVEKINGSFYNVMGLPIQRVYTELERFIETL